MLLQGLAASTFWSWSLCRGCRRCRLFFHLTIPWQHLFPIETMPKIKAQYYVLPRLMGEASRATGDQIRKFFSPVFNLKLGHLANSIKSVRCDSCSSMRSKFSSVVSLENCSNMATMTSSACQGLSTL